jgi:hypothetical protein
LCLCTLDRWAAHVHRETVRCAGQFERKPAEFESSWAYFRILVLATVLQEDCGVRYHPDLCDRDDFFRNAENLFVHGVLQGKGGTCTSLPPVYVAIGRRLGYPLKLVQTNSHLFARWDDPETGERFNIECTSRGLNCHSDDYYRGWPFPTKPEEVERFGWLLSMTPQEELGWFLACRAHCWLDNERYREAAEGYAWAASLGRFHRGYEGCLVTALNRWYEHLRPAIPADLPPQAIQAPSRRFPGLPADLEQSISRLEALENLLGNP